LHIQTLAPKAFVNNSPFTLLLLQYLGSRAPEPVKKKVLEMMYSWTVSLQEETKILDAYQMLKKQGNLMCRVLICHDWHTHLAMSHSWYLYVQWKKKCAFWDLYFHECC